MRRREIISLMSGVAVGWSSLARAQQPGERVRRVGVLTPSLVQLNREVLQRALEQRGHKEGVNLLLIIMSADGELERLASLVEHIARENSTLSSPSIALHPCNPGRAGARARLGDWRPF